MKDVYDILREWKKRSGEKCQSGSDFALATLVRAKGSTYRRPGARMLICNDGKTVGSLSAGCLEEEVALRARQVLLTGEPALMSFDTRKRFGCAGKIDIFIERVSQDFLCELAAHLDTRRSCLVITALEGSFVREAGSFPGKANSFPYSPLIQEIHPPIQVFLFGSGPDSSPLPASCVSE